MGYHGIGWVVNGLSGNYKEEDSVLGALVTNSEVQPSLVEDKVLSTTLGNSVVPAASIVPSLFSSVQFFCNRRRLRAVLHKVLKDGKWRQMACKPGSVPARRRAMAIHLGRSSPSVSRDRPGRRRGNPPRLACAGAPSLLGLAPGGVYRAASVTESAVRSYRTLSPLPWTGRGAVRGGLLSVALSLGSPPPDVIRHRISLEPGLSSPLRQGYAGRPSGHLARPIYRCQETRPIECEGP